MRATKSQATWLSILFRILDKTCGFMRDQAKHFGVKCCEVTEKINIKLVNCEEIKLMINTGEIF